MLTNEKIEKMAKMDDIMALPILKIITKEEYRKASLKFYLYAKEYADEYGTDVLFENIMKIMEHKDSEIKTETDEDINKYNGSRQVYYYYDQFGNDLGDKFVLNGFIDKKEILKNLLNETKDADIEEVKETLAKEYTTYYRPRVTDLFSIDEFKETLENRKKLYIIADRLPAIREDAQEYAEMALKKGYQAFIEIDGTAKEIKLDKEEETEQTPVGCVIVDLHAINSNYYDIDIRLLEDNDLFIFLKNTDYKEKTKYFTNSTAHEYRWMNTRKRVAVYYYKEGEEHPCQRITKGFSLYTNAFHYECYQRDKEERKEKAKEDSLTYIVENLHDAKKEGSNLENIVKRAKGEDVPLKQKEQYTYEDIKLNLTSSLFEEEDKAEILNTALALVEEPEEKEELPDALPCINESFDLITEITENKTLLPTLILDDIKTRAKADGYTINQVRQLFEKAIRAEEEADELSEDAQIQNAFYKLFKRIRRDADLGENIDSLNNIYYLIYTNIQEY